MSWHWLILAGIFKALRDRDEWGADTNDSIVLFYEDWEWYKKWRVAGSFLWLEKDSWHVFDMLTVFCVAKAMLGYVDALIATTVVLGVFTLFYHGLLLRNPLRGVRDWLNRYFG